MQIVGVCGDIGSGKDLGVAAHLIECHGFRHHAFATELKTWAFDLLEPLGVEKRHIFGTQEDKNEPLTMLSPNWRNPLECLSVDLFEPRYWTGRALLEYLGTEVGRRIHPDVWVKRLEKRILQIPDHLRLIVIPDVRFPNEFDAIHAMGGQVWRTFIDVDHMYGCAAALDDRDACECGAIESTGHESDMVWRHLPFDKKILAPKPGLEMIHAQVDVIMKEIHADV